MITYTGKRQGISGNVRVTVDGPSGEEGVTKRSRLRDRLDLRNHSPTGLEWGYEGSGPAQLALAICADHLERHELRRQSAAITLGIDLEPAITLGDRVALAVYQDFKRSEVARLPREDDWTMTDEHVGIALDAIVASRHLRSSVAMAAGGVL